MEQEHHFNVGIANDVGMGAAVLFANIEFWTAHNMANGTHFHDGRHWTYNSAKAFSELFPYMTERQVRTAIDKLVEHGYVLTGNYNPASFDRTRWFALTDWAEERFRGSHLTLKSNASDTDVRPIPDVNTDVTERPKDTCAQSARKMSKFVKPTVEEVSEYVSDKGYAFDPEEFWSFYESKGWVVGRSPMKSWKAACVSWQKKRSDRTPRNYGVDNSYEGWGDFA